MERKQEGMGKSRARKHGNTEKIVEAGKKERGRNIKKEQERGREKYLSLPEIPGMNGGINSLSKRKGKTTGWNAVNICRKS